MDFLVNLPWLTIHVTAVMITLTVVIVADLHGLLWLLGKKQTLPAGRMRWLHRATWTGLIITMIAGAMMFSSYPEYLLSLWAFRFKLLFVLALCINAFLIGKHLEIAFTTPFAEIPSNRKRALIISGAVSTVSWIGAYVMAHLLS